ncbi:MAG: putative toxin-antitoxin system toxin component, PIN family [Deltaproteobacteria bacterium]|nr:MAG: putative toxin-antitoxin system toxin component, PIN family [Deltaproteobacteria bacterium]
MVRSVIDANVLISAAFGGTPLDAVSRAFSIGEVYLSPAIVAEIVGTIERLSSKLGEQKTGILSTLWKRFESLCRMAEPERGVSICRDPKDDAYLSLCAAVGANYLITGDKDLLAVDPSRVPSFSKGLKILTPRQFLEADAGEA